MIRQCEFQTMYDPDLDMYVTKHIFDDNMTNIFDDDMTVGGGMTDIFKAVGRKLFGRASKKAAEKATKAAGEYAGYKAGDRIVKLLSNDRTMVPSVVMEPTVSPSESNVLTDQEINDRVNQILSGGRLKRRRRNFI